MKNPFNEQKFIAEDKDNDKWLFIKQKDKDAYLKVDTAYTNETGTKFLAYGWTEKAKDKADAYSSISSELRAQHKFKFIYSPSGDSLYIYVKKLLGIMMASIGIRTLRLIRLTSMSTGVSLCKT